MNAQSFARCETNRAFINVQRMHDGGRTKSLHDAATPTTAIRHSATLSPAQQAGYYFWCGGCENPQLAGRARMHDSACPKFRKDAKPTEQAQFDNPAQPQFSPLNQRGIIFWCWGCENPQLAGKARMPYKMNAQSFKQGCLKPAALSCHTMWQPKRLTRQ